MLKWWLTGGIHSFTSAESCQSFPRHKKWNSWIKHIQNYSYSYFHWFVSHFRDAVIWTCAEQNKLKSLAMHCLKVMRMQRYVLTWLCMTRYYGRKAMQYWWRVAAFQNAMSFFDAIFILRASPFSYYMSAWLATNIRNHKQWGDCTHCFSSKSIL